MFTQHSKMINLRLYRKLQIYKKKLEVNLRPIRDLFTTSAQLVCRTHRFQSRTQQSSNINYILISQLTAEVDIYLFTNTYSTLQFKSNYLEKLLF